MVSCWWKKVWITGAVLLLASLLVCAETTDSHKPPSHKQNSAKGTTASHSSKTSRRGKKSHKTASSWRRGQQKIDSQRAREIQAALIHEHYLDGEPTGNWDANSQKAMERYQADNGWQSKAVPDSRALIKLGLGPGHEHLLNPETSMINGQGASTPAVAPVVSTPAIPVTDSGSNPPQRR